MLQAIVAGALVGALIGGTITGAVRKAEQKDVYTFGDAAAVTEQREGRGDQ